METHSYTADSTTDTWNKSSLNDQSSRFDPNETPTVNSTNPNYQPGTNLNNNNWEKSNSTLETAADKAKGELKKGQQHAEDIITKSKRLLKQQCKFKQWINVLYLYLSSFPCGYYQSLEQKNKNRRVGKEGKTTDNRTCPG